MLCSPAKGQATLNCRTNVNHNVKVWLTLHLETVIREKRVKAKLDIATLM